MQSINLCGTFKRPLGSTESETGTITSFEISFHQYGDRPDGRVVCTAFGKTGERALDFSKGKPAIFQGYLDVSEYQGERKTKLIVQNIIEVDKPILLNSAIVIGRMGDFPDVRFFEDSRVVTKASIAVPKPKKDAEKPTWIKAELWNKPASVMADYCQKGSLVGISGKLVQDSWKDSEGNLKTALKVQGDNLRLLGSKPEEASQKQPEKTSVSYDDAPW